jgi:hypothetical protein
MKRKMRLSQSSFRHITWIVVIGFAFGALTVAGQATLHGSWNHFANSGAVWLIAAFAVGALMSSVGWAAIGGFITLVMALAGYTAAVTALGLTYPFTTIVLWGAVALVSGPLFGLAGLWWRSLTSSWRHAAGAALMGGVFIAEGWYWLTIIQDSVAGWVSIVIGVFLAILLPRSWKDRFRSLAALTPIALLGIGAFALLPYWIG